MDKSFAMGDSLFPFRGITSFLIGIARRRPRAFSARSSVLLLVALLFSQGQNGLHARSSSNAFPPPFCTPVTQKSQEGFGITHVSFNKIDHDSKDAATEGYADFTDVRTEVLAGKSYTLFAVTDEPTTHDVRAWIDLNDNGTFDTATEQVLSQESVLNPSSEVIIPANTPLNTPLRLRISADLDAGNPLPTPCSDLEYGQAEDYTVIVKENDRPPKADFVSRDTFSCDGEVSFINESENLPTSYEWHFGDGSTSGSPDPTHTYDSSGVYTVQLVAFKGNESDTLIRPEYIEVDKDAAVRDPSCTPQTLSYCCEYGIFRVSLGAINHSSGNAKEGYKDHSCDLQATLKEKRDHSLSIETGPDNPQDTRVWIDLNDDGDFQDQGEKVFEALDQKNPSGTIRIEQAPVHGQPLRMRVSSDVIGTPLDPCTDPERGQVEDYGIVVRSPSGIPNESRSRPYVSVFPNPARETIHVVHERRGVPFSLKITDIAGRVVHERPSNKEKEGRFHVPVGEWRLGVYFVILQWEDRPPLTEKVLIRD